MPTLAETENPHEDISATRSLFVRAVMSAAALFNPTTKRNEGARLAPFLRVSVLVTYVKYAPSSSH